VEPEPDDEQGHEAAARRADGPEPDARARGWFRRRRVALVIGAVILVAGGGGVALAGGDSCPSGNAVVEAGGGTVSEQELSRRAELVEALYGLSPPEGERADAYRRELAKSVATALLIEREARRRDIVVPDRAVRDALDRYIADFFPEGGRDRFVTAMGNKGISEAEVLAEFRQIQTTFRVLDEATKQEAVTDADVTAAYADRKDSLAVPERRRIRHVVVATEAEATGVLTRVRRGESFVAVAKATSLDASTKDQGGELGLRAAADLEEAFGRAAFAAAPGQPFGPVQTRFGWHVAVVTEVVAGRPLSADEAREPLREQLLGERRLAAQRQFVASLLRQGDVCYAERFRPGRPDAPPPGGLNPGGGNQTTPTAPASPGTPATPAPK
jgi:peptidyl-prolyl cis-trans isomerase C